MKLNLGSGAHPLDGFENLDATDGWRFQDGLTDYADGSVEAITESHALYLVPVADWPDVFKEIARVLEPGGVVRIAEDAATDPRSSRYGGFEGAVTLTSVDLVRAHFDLVGLRFEDVAENYSHFRDGSLIQTWHGGSPKCFFVEGIKE